MGEKKIGVFVGSLRKESFSKKIARELIRIAPDTFKMEEVFLEDLPIYNQDFDDENRPPAAYTRFREQVQRYDAFLFVTPEYNRSVPAVLKNALDVGSRPYGKSVWDGKPGAIISVSSGRLSGFGANHHLRQSMVFLNVPIMQQPEAYIGDAGSLFDDNGNMNNENSRQFFKKFIDAFFIWVETNTPQ
jgi:chromate reductase